MLSQQAITDFKEIWKQENRESISDDLAIEEALKLLTIFDAIYRPIKNSSSANPSANLSEKP